MSLQNELEKIYDHCLTTSGGEVAKYIPELANDIQHNPKAPTGRQGFIDFFLNISQGQTRAIPEAVPRIVSMQAEGDIVTLSFVWKLKDKDGKEYTSTWFDMFKIKSDEIVEHWDNATL